MTLPPDQRLDKVFILGSGFSKAVSPHMPTVKDLSDVVKDKARLEPELRSDKLRTFIEKADFETLLSYLAQNAHWKDRSEFHAHQSLFFKIADRIVQEITEKETQGLNSEAVPPWLHKLVAYFDKQQSWVVTFNYDTILERVAFLSKSAGGYINHVQTGWLYPKIMRNISTLFPQEGFKLVQSNERNSFHLIKMHGSINWFYSGEYSLPGEQIYFGDANNNNPKDDYHRIHQYVQGKERLIIPPVAEKSPFYGISLIRTLWSDAQKALGKAKEVYFLGYSLPEMDLTTRLLLMSAIPEDAKVYIVSRGKTEVEKKALIERYARAMPQLAPSHFDSSFIRDGAVEELAASLFETLDKSDLQNLP
jgi:hypothetical protein